jgi:uncharacterized membrane protein
MKLKDVAPEVKPLKRAKKLARTAKKSGLLEKLEKLPLPGSNGDGDEKQEGVGDGRRMPIQQSVDVAVPVETAWKLWNKYEDYPKFMHREKIDPKHVHFTGKVWGIRREWDAEITEKRTHETVAWVSEDGLENAGVVSFHKLGPRLTHIELNLDIAPHGPIEKMGRGLRFTKRAVRADLHRFKAYAEMNDA